MRNIAGWKKAGSRERGAHQEDRKRGEKRYQGGRKISSLLKRDRAGDAEKEQQQLFSLAILLRNLWVICCRGKTFCLPPLKNRLN